MRIIKINKIMKKQWNKIKIKDKKLVHEIKQSYLKLNKRRHNRQLKLSKYLKRFRNSKLKECKWNKSDKIIVLFIYLSDNFLNNKQHSKIINCLDQAATKQYFYHPSQACNWLVKTWPRTLSLCFKYAISAVLFLVHRCSTHVRVRSRFLTQYTWYPG